MQNKQIDVGLEYHASRYLSRFLEKEESFFAWRLFIEKKMCYNEKKSRKGRTNNV